MQRRGGVGGFDVFGDGEGVHYVFAIWGLDGRDGVFCG